MHGATLLFTAALVLVTGLAPELAPEIHASRPNIREALKEAPEIGFGGPRRHGLRCTLVTIEVALTMALLISARLLLRSVAHVSGMDPSFQTTGPVAITVNLPRSRCEPDAMVLRFWQALLERVRALPGEILATGTSDRWLEGQRIMEFNAENQTEARLCIPIAQVRSVTPGYFKTLGSLSEAVCKNSGSFFNDQAYNASATGLPGRITPVVEIGSPYRK